MGDATGTPTAAWMRHLAGRGPVGHVEGPVPGPTLRKRGIRHVRLNPSTGEEQETFVLGGACSEIFSGSRLAKVLTTGVEAQKRALEQLHADTYAETLSIHTSAGLPPAASDFLEALAPHLPWSEPEDWCCSLQLEGGSAVLAGVDLLVQLQRTRGHAGRSKVTVAERSYHGPAATAPGAPDAPLFPKDWQLTYPAPTIMRTSLEGLEAEFEAFLEEHGEEIAVMLFEPQWGSSNVSKVWPPEMLRRFIELAHGRGILVLCDEIMCGLGRHGQGACFLTKAWGLDADAVTFGKAVASGVFPLSGAILRRGQAELQRAGKGVMHMHTYAGAGQLALLAGVEVLKMLPAHLDHVAAMGSTLGQTLGDLEKETGGFVQCHGQGLMWGAVFSGSEEERAKSCHEFRRHCFSAGVWPYFVPIGGFQITPVLDVTAEELHQGLQLLVECVRRTKAARHAGSGA